MKFKEDSQDDTLRKFWDRVLKSDGCWNWTGKTYGRNGYGMARWIGKVCGAHRVSWIIHNGPIPEGLKVLHTCDNPICVRPDHLFLGTQTDNIKDMDAKGRRVVLRGEETGRSKLTEEDVKKIRGLYKRGVVTLKYLSGLFDVSISQIQYIVTNKQWRHVSDTAKEEF